MTAIHAPCPAHPIPRDHWADRPIRPCTCEACAELDLQFPGGGRQLAFALLPPPVPAPCPGHLETAP